jgi:hypothetical protein
LDDSRKKQAQIPIADQGNEVATGLSPPLVNQHDGFDKLRISIDIALANVSGKLADVFAQSP